MVVRGSAEEFPDSDLGGRPGGGPSRPSGRDGGGLLVFGRPAKIRKETNGTIDELFGKATTTNANVKTTS